MSLVLLTLLVVFGTVGAFIARSRGYSALLGFAVGWTGLAAWVVLAFLPAQTETAPGPHSAVERRATSDRFAGIERWLRTMYPLTVGCIGLLTLVGVLASTSPVFSAYVAASTRARALLELAALLAITGTATMWGLSLYLLTQDPRLPAPARGPWTAALILFNLLASLFFVPWRWYVLRRRGRRGAASLLA
jgi:hypothetical protein